MADLTKITTPIALPDLSEIKAAQQPLIEKSEGYFEIVTIEQQSTALELLRDIRANVKAAKLKFKSIKDPMNAAKKAVDSWEHEVIDPWEVADTRISQANSNFILKQKREAEHAAHMARQKAQEEEDRRALERAEVFEFFGDSEGANEILEEAIAAPPPTIYVAPIQVAKVQGISSRVNYSAKVTNLQELVEYCLKNPALLSMFIVANDSALNGEARRAKEEFSIPGCELVTKYV